MPPILIKLSTAVVVAGTWALILGLIAAAYIPVYINLGNRHV